MERINVAIVSDVRLHRDGLARLLWGCPSITVLGTHTVPEALTGLSTMPIRVALIDAPLRGFETLVEAIRRIRSSLAVVALGIRETASDVLSCAAAGVDAYVSIDATLGEMVSTVERVVSGCVSLPARIEASLAPTGTPVLTPFRPLTQRELKVADLLNLGFGNKEIARRLNIEPCTAKNHVRNIMNKLNVHRRGEAVAALRALIGERFSTPVNP